MNVDCRLISDATIITKVSLELANNKRINTQTVIFHIDLKYVLMFF